MQRLAQIVARGRQETRFGEIGQLELLRAFLDLALERGMPTLQLGRHAVELVAQRLKLIAGLDRDTLIEIATSDPRRAIAQGPDRYHHSARQEGASQNREAKRSDHQHAGTQDRGIDRPIGFNNRQLHEHQPAKRGNGRVDRQDPLTLEVVDIFLRRRRHRAGAARRPDLGKVRQIGVAQHGIDIRMGDQSPIGIHHIGPSPISSLDLRDDIPNELEIDLRHDHPVFAAGAGNCDGHIGL